MQTAADFNAIYASPDPWHLKKAGFRNRAIRRAVQRFVRGKSILELGCGEGHLTQTVFGEAHSVVGVDFSEVAIERAKARGLPCARFETADFLEVSFEGYDVITAIECLYYLTPEHQAAFFSKVAREHQGKLLIVSAPIIGANEAHRYYTHQELVETFNRYRMTVVATHNLNLHWRTPAMRLAAAAVRVPFGERLLDMIPDGLIYQRCYVARTAASTA